MNVLTIDCETTISNNGSPFDKTNRLVCIGLKTKYNTEIIYFPCSHEDQMYIQGYIDNADIIIGFNIKFDLHWIKNIGIDFSGKRIWDCQLGEFLLENQQNPYPSLNQAAEKYGLGTKIDVVKNEFWDRSCSCHVSIVERILHIMQKDYACSAILESMSKGIEKKEMLISVHGEQLIPSVMQKLSEGELRSYLLILRQRLEHIEYTTNESTNLLTVSMIDSWLKQFVAFAEALKTWQLTTTIQQEKLETDCVSIVTQLWHILSDQNGWRKHNSICEHTPVDTDCIPREILSEYLEQDLILTEKVYLKQIEQFKTNGKLPLMRLHCADLLVLQEMEYNGIVFKTKEAMEFASSLDQELQTLYSTLVSIIGNVPINLASNDHLSALFYGGIIAIDERIPIGVYKSGSKVGHPRYKILVKEYVLPRLVEPIESTETAKSKELEIDDLHRTWRTSEDVLRSLKVNKQAKEIVDLVGKYSKIEKLKGTYLEGYTKLIEKMNWEEDMLHGSLNQCVAVTGRLSSTKPNLQNADSTTKLFMTTRYI